MRRSICGTEPSWALAGETKTWKFIYTTSVTVAKGACLKFDLLSKGRDIDWDIPSINLKAKDSVIYAELPGHSKPLQAREVEIPDSLVPQYEFVLPVALKTGESFTITLGAPPNAEKEHLGAACQTTVQRRRPFLLFIDPKGNGDFQDPELFSMDIRGNKLSNVRIIAPSFTMKNKRFDVTIRFEDEFGNLTGNAPEGTLVELSHQNQRENLNWKLFVPETGIVTIPNFYFNEPGNYRIQLSNLQNNQTYFSGPIRCFQDNDRHLLWGLFHGESERVDSTESIELCLQYFRDEKAFGFFSTSSFESVEETPSDIWKIISQNVTEFNEPERFASLLGFQWAGTSIDEGLRQIVYAKDNKGLLRKKDSKFSSLKKIYKAFAPGEALSIPCFTMAGGMGYHFKNFNPDFERVVEIYNAWGSSECTTKEGNSFPIKGGGKHGVKENANGSIRAALAQNHRFGFVSGGLDDRGAYSNLFDSNQVQYTPGLTAIISKDHSREGVMDALYRRSCYATSGENIILDMHLAGAGIGSELGTSEKPGLSVNRHFEGFVAGASDLESVELICNGKVLKSFELEGDYIEFMYDHLEDLAAVTIKKDKVAPFVYYYLRVTQKNGHMAWSSPIWVDDFRLIAKKRAAALVE